MSDRRVRGGSDDGSNSELDQVGDSSSDDSTLGAVGQEEGQSKDSKIQGDERHHGEGPLTGSTSKRGAVLGAHPREEEGGKTKEGGRRQRGKGKGVEWSNKERKMAKSHRGRGQMLRLRKEAAQRAAGACAAEHSATTSPSATTSASLVRYDIEDLSGECAENDTCVGVMSKLLLLFLPMGALLLSDLSRDWVGNNVSPITGNTREEALRWAISFAVAFTCFALVFAVILLRIMCAGGHRERRR